MQNEIDVKHLRKSLGYSQARFAEILGVKQSTVSKWESGGVPARGSAKKLLLSFSAFGKAFAQEGLPT